MRMSVSAIICAIVCSIVVTTSLPVQAQDRYRNQTKVRKSFFERLFSGETRRKRRERLRREQLRRSRPVSNVRVSSPKIYTYKPDVPKSVSLAKLAAVKVASVSSGSDGSAAAANNQPTSDADISVAETGRQGADSKSLSQFDQARGYLSTFRLRALSDVGTAIKSHYSTKPEFIWITDGQVNAKALAVLDAFERADTFGLSPDDYRVERPADMIRTESIEEPPVGADTQNVAADADQSAVPAPAAGTVPESISPLAVNTTSRDSGPEETAEDAIPVNAVMDAAGTAGASPDSPAPAASEDQLKALMEFEMKLSAKALTYVLDATRGRIDPNRLSGYHDLPRHKVDLAAALEAIAANDDAGDYLESAHPDNAQFMALKAELADLRGRDDEAPITIAKGTLIKPGKSHTELANVIAGIDRRASETLKAEHAETLSAYDNGDLYAPDIVALVRSFQKESGLTADGVIGSNTIRALTGTTNADKVEKITLAMERLRWLPRDLGKRRVFVNQPAYNVTYFDPGKDPLSMRVVVGKKSNQTNFFYDEIETVEFNPYWGVPYSIIVNEMMPKLNQDPFYLDNAGYEVTTAQGQRISSASVDWYQVATKTMPINVRQPPGRSNALGSLKILFPNKHAIYMHDTPAKSLFKRDRRAFSHGCIRLQHPGKMAAAVLGKSTDYISSRVAQGQNDSDPVPGNIPVYSSYFTAWPTLEQEIGYYDDVYGRDARLIKALDVTSATRLKNS